MDEKIKTLIDFGIVREQFIREADKVTLDAADTFANRYARSATGYSCYEALPKALARRTIGAHMIKHGILTPELIENTIVASTAHITKPGNDASDLIVARWAEALGTVASPKVVKLITNKSLGSAAVMAILKENRRPFADDNVVERSAHVLTPGASNVINWGMTNIIEFEAARRSVGPGGTRRDEFLHLRHRLLKAMRTTEFVGKKRMQVSAVVGANDPRPLKEQLDVVWQHYAAQSKLFREIDAEPRIAGDVRAKNVRCVNQWQARKSRETIQSPRQRFIDIYGRYNCGEMDPLMLAMIARTVGWYVDNQHASLFTNVRLIPDYCRNDFDSLDAIPWAALAAHPKMLLLRVRWEDFLSSLFGANRMFLTNAAAREANWQQSIPIIGLATWKNSCKYKKEEPYALLEADFDEKDPHRNRDRAWKGADQSASIAGTIDETLRALREVERLEIARAQDIPLEIGVNHRWAPSSRLIYNGPSRESIRELSASSLSFGA